MHRIEFITPGNARATALAFLMLFGCGVLDAQSPITATPDFLEHTWPNDDLPVIIHLIGEIANSSQDTIIVGWQRIIDSDCPEHWEVSVMDRSNHYLPHVAESVSRITLEPQETDEPIGIFLSPHDALGCGNIYLVLRAFDDPSVIFDTITYQISMSDSSCLTTSVANISETHARIEILPNPVLDFFTVSDSLKNDQVHIYNALGVLVRRFDNHGAQRFDVSGLAAGIYTVQVRRDGRIVGVERIVKG